MSVVTTAAGQVRGTREGAVGVWRGIPYAAPPVGPHRFRAPQPVVPWPGVRDATAFGPSAPQPPSRAEEILGLAGHLPSAEDCLYLNVWSTGPDGPARPVMVWLHGGGFLTGAGTDPLYDGRSLAERGVVVVTLNYRLGALGFLHLLDPVNGEADTNCGLRDQLAALVWVRDNIAAFGGDPERVTLFGQSAGAMAVATLLGVSEADGLFARAVLQSGAAGHVHQPADARRIARATLRRLGLRRADMGVLRAMPVQQLVDAGSAVAARVSLRGLPFQPMVDGSVVPAPPLEALQAGRRAGTPLLIGTTREEIALYAAMATSDPAPALLKRVRRWLVTGALAAGLGPRRFLRLGRAYRGEGGGTLGLVGDLVFGRPAWQLAEAQASHAPVYAYRFDWGGPELRACHAVELPFVWNALDRPEAAVIARNGVAERALAEQVQAAWAAFARAGAPEAAGLPHWPPYGAGRQTMILDLTPRLATDPGQAQRLAWG